MQHILWSLALLLSATQGTVLNGQADPIVSCGDGKCYNGWLDDASGASVYTSVKKCKLCYMQSVSVHCTLEILVACNATYDASCPTGNLADCIHDPAPLNGTAA